MRSFVATLLCLLATPLGAHPHVFVDTTLRLSVDDAGQATGIEVTWRYDDFFTLLIFEDMGLDPDGDGVLTGDELARLKGFDMVEWPEGFEGDLYVYRGDEKLPLGFPVSTGIAVEDGRIVATHTRSFGPVPADGLTILQYDPTFYVAYEVTGGIEVSGGCAGTIEKPDLDAAARKVAELTSDNAEDMFSVLEVGIYYADRILVTCSGG